MFLSREIGDGETGKISEIGEIWEEEEDSGGTTATTIGEIEDRRHGRKERTSEKLLSPPSVRSEGDRRDERRERIAEEPRPSSTPWGAPAERERERETRELCICV
ncbi:hypothetical protein CsSME_00006131 [Camellia sinensis var. sinensis]